MPKLSLYKPHKSKDYIFIDRQVAESFRVGGTDAFWHLYLGPKNPATGSPILPIYGSQSVTNIQDLLLLENRDRMYDSAIHRLRVVYNVANIDFNLSQFGLFIDTDTIFVTVHINDSIKILGRKPLSGDVVELPHLRDEFALNDADVSLPRYYVVEDVGRASEGFSATWYPHLYRVKLKKLVFGQAYSDIMNVPTGEDADRFAGEYASNTTYYPGQIVRVNGVLYQVKTDGSVPNSGTTEPVTNTDKWIVYSGGSLVDLITSRNRDLEINDGIIAQAEIDSPASGYETRQFYTMAVDSTGKPIITINSDASVSYGIPLRSGYTGYLLGDGFPPNGYPFGSGIQFPENPKENDYFLRIDMLPNRLYKFINTSWVKMEDSVRLTLSNTDTKQTLKTSFINNTNMTYSQELGSDWVNLPSGATAFNTTIDYVNPKYVRISFQNYSLDYSISDHPNSIIKYTDSENRDKIRIVLPIISSVQETIPVTGLWKVALYNYRENQRQNIHTALKPRADL